MKKYLILTLFISLTYIVNAQVPNSADNTVTVNEDNDYVFLPGDFPFNDGADGDNFILVEISSAASAGTLFDDANGNNIVDGGETITGGEVIPIGNITNLKFRPDPDDFGLAYSTFTFRVSDDDEGYSAVHTMTVDVTAINDQPSFTNSGGNPIILEDAGPQTLNNWATAIVLGPANETPPPAPTFDFTANDNPALFSAGPAIDPVTGDLTYTPAANAFGVANLTVVLNDHDGGSELSISENFSITVTAENDLPIGAPQTVNCFENSFVTFNAGNFNYSDIESDPFSQLQVTTVPANGDVWLDLNTNGIIDGGESPLLATASVSIADITSNQLRFRPDPDENGSPYANFDFRVHDGIGFSTLSYTMTINVLAVNSEPSFTMGANPVIINEDAPAQNIAWAINIEDGDIEVVQGFLGFFTNITSGAALFSVVPSVNTATGNLTYTPAANANGTATIDIYLQDDGGGLAPNDDTSPTQTFSITINPINDVPGIATNFPLNINEGELGQLISTGLLEVTDVDNTPAEIEYTITNVPASGTLYLSGLPLGLNDTYTQADINANALTYSHDGTEGTPDSYFFTVNDGAGGLIGATQFIINLAPVNDAPVFTSLPITTGAQLVLYTYNITTTDAEGNPLVIAPVTIPAWLVLVDNGDGTATLSGIPPGGTPINNPITISVSDGIAPPVTQSWNLQISSSVTADAGLDDITCNNDEYTLNAVAAPVGYTGTWSVISGAGIFTDPNLPNTLVSGLDSGLAPANSNTLRWTLSNGIPAEDVWDDVVITNNTVVASVTDINNVCGTSAIIQADNALNPGEVGLWTVEGAPFPLPTIVSPNSRTTVVNGLNYNVNQFRWTLTKETCSDFAIMNVDVIEVFATAGGPAEICSEPFAIIGNDPALLGGTGLWTVGAGSGVFADAINPNTTVTGSHQDVINEYVWTVTVNGCQAQASVFVENNTPSPATITTAYPATVSCDGTGTISAVPADATDPNEIGFWTTVTPGVVITDPNFATTTVTNLQEGANLFTWHITNGTCPESTANVTIYYYITSNVNAGPDAIICSDVYNLAASPLDAGETGLWSFSTGSGFIVNPVSNTTEVNNLQRGLNTLRWTVLSNGECPSFDFVNITNMSVDAIISTTDPLVACTDPSPLITANNANTQDIANPATAATGFWAVLSGGSVVDSPLAWNTTVSNLDPGANDYVWTITNGTCTDSDTITVINNIPTQAYAGKDTIVCSTSLPNLNGNNYDSFREIGYWRRIAGNATITDISLANTSVTNLDYYCTPWTPDWWTNQAAVNVFEWVIERTAFGVTCESTDQVSVANGLPETIDAGIDQTVCDNVVNLDALDEASCADDYWWEQLPDVGDFEDPLTGAFIPDNDLNMPFNVHVNNIQDGMSQFVWHKRNNFFDSMGNPIQCELTDTVEITSLGLVEDVQAGPEDATCDDWYTLNATPPATVFNTGTDVVSGQWSLIFGAGNFDDDTYYNTTVRNMAAYDNIYRWTVTNETLGCVLSDDVYIHSARASSASAGPDDTTCVDFAVLASNVPVRYTSAYWTVDWGSGTIIQNSCTGFTCDAQAFGLSYDLNTFVWHVENEYTGGFGGYDAANPLVCSVTDTVNIWYRGVTAVAGPDIYECGDFTQLFANDPAGKTGVWSGSGTFDDSGTNTSTLFNDVVRGLTRGKNTFTWTISNESCSDADQTVVWGLLPPVPFANVDQTECTSSVDLNANDVTDYWSNVDPVPPNPVWQEATASGYWTSTNPSVTFVNASNFNTTATGTSAQTEDAFIWHSLNNFTDHVAGITRTCELTDTMLYYNNAVTATAGADIFECGIDLVPNSFNLNAVPVIAPLSGVWTKTVGPAATIFNPLSPTTLVTNVFQDNDYTFTWTVSSTVNGRTCTASDDMVVQVRIPSNSVVNPSTLEVCVNQAPLVGNVPISGNGTWNSTSPGTINDPTSSVTFVDLIQNGVSQWNWTIDREGCISEDYITVTNNTVTADADLALIDPNVTDVCIPEYNLNATDPNIFNVAPPFATGNWTANFGTTTFDNTSIFNTTVRNLSSAFTNTLTWTVTKGSCIESSQLTINNNEFFVDADVDQIVCDGTATLNGEQAGTGTGIWTYVSGSGGNIVTPSQYDTQVTAIVPGGSSLFRWTVMRNGCVAWDDMTVTNNEVSANAGSDQTTCSSDILNMPATDPGAGITGNWQLVFGNGIPADPTLYNTSVSGLDPNINTFRWNVARSICTDFDLVNIINNEPADFILNGAAETCDGNSTISVNAYPPNGSGIWTQTSGSGIIVDNTNINTAITGLESGNNQYTWTVTNAACTKAAFIDVVNNQVIADAGIPLFVCADSVNLAALDPLTNNTQQGNGMWTLLAGNGNFETPTLYNTLVRNMDVGINTFVWTLTLGSCSDPDIAEVTNNAVVADATDQTVCINSATFDGNNPGSATGTWTLIAPIGPVITTPSSNISTVTNLGPGVNTFRWLVDNVAGCADSIDIQINNGEFITSAGPDQLNLCSTSSVLDGTDHGIGFSGQWVVVAGSPFITNPTLFNTTVTGLNNGINTYRWVVNSSDCSAFDEVDIENNLPTLADIGTPIPANREICVNSAAVEAIEPIYGTGQWTISSAGSTFINSTNYQTVVNDLILGDNEITWTVTNGVCSDQDVIIIRNNQVIADPGIDKTTLCNDFTTLSGNDPSITQGDGIWTDLDGTSANIINNTLYNTLVSNLRQGTTQFRWTVSLGACIDGNFDQVVITNNQITALAGPDQSTCVDFINPLDGNDVSISGGTGVWTTTGPGLFVQATDFNTQINNLQSGLNTLTWTVTSAVEGCTDLDEVVISNDGVVSDAGVDFETCNFDINLSAVAPIVGAGSWTQTGGAPVLISNSTDRQTLVSGLNGGSYSFTWTVVNGICSDDDEVVIINSYPNISNPITSTPEVCDGIGILQANAPVLGETGLWTGGPGSTIAVASNNNTTVSGMPLGLNTYIWTLTKGTGVTCMSANSVDITNNQVIADPGPDKTTLCNDFTSLSGNDPSLTQGSGLWTDIDGTTAIITNNTLYNTTVTNLRNGTTQFRWTVSLGTCIDGTIDQVVITNNQITASAGPDQSTCNDFINPLDGNDVSISGGTGVWTTTGPGVFVQATDFNTQINNLQSGLNTLRWTVTSAVEGCTDNDDVVISYNGVVSDAGADFETCDFDINLSAVAPTSGAGFWTQSNGAPVLIDNSTDRQTLVSGLNGGSYTFTWTVVNGICSDDDEVVIINSYPNISNPITSTPEVCDGIGILQANAPVLGETGLWTGGPGSTIAVASNNNTTVSGMPLGLNTYIWTLTKGTGVTCMSANPVDITNNQVIADPGPDKTTLCNDFTTLSGNDPLLTQGSGLWTDIDGTTAIITNNTLYNTTVTNLRNGTTQFRWTVSLGTCIDGTIDQVVITNNQISASAGPDQSTCNDFINPLDGNDVSIIGGTGVWTTTGPGVFVQATDFNTQINNLQSGLNTLIWTVTSAVEGCTDNDDVVISYNGVVSDAGADFETCDFDINLSAVAPSSGAGVWTQSNGAPVLIDNSTDRQTLVSGLNGGSYTFKWTVTNGLCSDEDEVVIINSFPSISNPTTPSDEECDGNGTLQANAPLLGETGLWTGGGSSTIAVPSNNNTTVSGMPIGVNTFTWTLTKGTGLTCTSANSIEISNNQVASEAGPDQMLCTNTATLAAIDPITQYPNQGTGNWSIFSGAGAIITNSAQFNTTVDNLIGTTVFRWTVSKGNCDAFDDVTITNATVTANATNALTCTSTVTALTGTDPGPGESGFWTCSTPGVTFNDNTLYNTEAYNLVPGNNTFIWEVTNGNCTDNANIIVEYVDPLTNAGGAQDLCVDYAYMTAQDPSPGTGFWTVETGSGTFTNSSVHNTFVSGIGVGLNVYVWTVTEQTCFNIDKVTINNNSPDAYAGSDFTTCNSFSSLNATGALAGQTGLWTGVGGTGIVTDPTVYNSAVTNLSAGVNVFQWTIDNGFCQNSDEVRIYNNEITSTNAGVDLDICGSSTDLAALSPGVGETGSWYAVSGTALFDDSNLYNTGVSNLARGGNLLRWTLTNGTCDDSDDIVITNNSPTVSNVSADAEICSNIYTLLGNAPNASDGETGLWTLEFGASATIIDPTSNITTAISIGAGDNTFRWTISNAQCDSFDDIVISNNTITTDAGLDVSLCTDTTILSADDPAPGTGLWEIVNSSGTPTFDNASAFNTIVRNLANGSNIFKWTATKGGCSAWGIVTISNDDPTDANAGDDIVVCDGTVLLQGNNPSVGVGVWSRLGGAGVITNPSNYNTTVTGLSSGGNTFRWLITEGMCESYDDVLITNELVFASAGMDDNICGDSYNPLNGNQPGIGESGVWTVTGGTGNFTNPTLYNTGVTGLSGSENVLTWTVTRGSCDNSDNVSIFDNTPSPASVSSDQEVCDDFTVISGNPPTTGVGEWSVAAGSGDFDNSLANTTTVRNIGPDINIYRWTITNGTCTDAADLTVINNSVTAVVGDSIFVCGTDAFLNGNEPTTGQTGVWTRTAGTGILAVPSQYNTAVTNLNVGINKYRWSISNGTCDAYADLVVTNNLYDATASVAGPDTICTDSADLLGNIPIQGCSGHWEIFAGAAVFSDPNSPTTRVNDLNKGENTLRWFITKAGCSNFADVSITNNMVNALAGPDVITCGNDANLSANELLPEETGLWTIIGGSGTILSPSDNETVITGQSSGVSVYQWTVDGNNCTDSDVVQVNENSFLIEAGPAQTVCEIDATLSGQNPTPGTGLWTTGSGVLINNLTSYVTTVTGLQDNSPHTFRWTVAKNGCTAWDEVVVTNNLVTANAGADKAVCFANTVLNADNPVAGDGLWNITSGAGTITIPSYYASPVTGLTAGTITLTWTVVHENCTSADNMVITNNMVTATAGPNQAICEDFATLDGDVPQAGGYGLWTTAGGPGIVQTPSAFDSQVTGLQRGVNTFRWTVYENTCTNGGALVQVINNTFDANAGLDQTLVPLDTDTYFDAELLTNQTGQWSILSGSANIYDETSATSFVYNMPTGTHEFTWTVLNNLTGCSDVDNVFITVANFEPDAGDDQIVCVDTAKLNAQMEPGASSHTWSVVSGSGVFDDIHDSNTVVRSINLGANVFRWTVTFIGYSNYDDVIIYNDSIFVSAGVDAVTCEREYTMKAQQFLDPDSAWWSPVGGGATIIENSAWNTLVTDLVPGDSYFEWYVSNGNCESRDTVILTYNLPPIAQFEADPVLGCAPFTGTIQNTSTQFGGQSPPDEFEWVVEDDILVNTFDISGSFTYDFTNTAEWDSIYHIRLVAIDYETMCTDTFYSEVTATAGPEVKFLVVPDEPLRIPNAVFTFQNKSAVDLIEYEWDFGNGDDRYDYTYVPSFDYEYNTPGTYTITLNGTSSGQCDGSYSATVIVLPACPFSWNDGATIADGCQELEVDFYNDVYYADDPMSTLWHFYGPNDDVPANVNRDSTTYENDPIYVYTEPGEFHPYITAWNASCGSELFPHLTRVDTVIVNPKPIVDFDVAPRLVMLPEQLLTCFNYSEYGFEYEWDFGDDTISSDNFEENPQHLYSAPGVYDIHLSVWTVDGCFDSLSIQNAVYVEQEGSIEFPNAFTPNPNGSNGGVYPCGEIYRVDKDNLNDVFYPKQTGVDSYTLEIYNRWGEKIFISNELCTGWDGYVDGVLAPQDVYVWKVAVTYRNGEPERKYGSVTLLR